jgi:hypothetical protein
MLNHILQDDIKNKKNEIQTLDDATTDIMMMEDDEEQVIKHRDPITWHPNDLFNQITKVN